eukprot:131783-Pleurochrysis_carterae.AAC.3
MCAERCRRSWVSGMGKERSCTRAGWEAMDVLKARTGLRVCEPVHSETASWRRIRRRHQSRMMSEGTRKGNGRKSVLQSRARVASASHLNVQIGILGSQRGDLGHHVSHEGLRSAMRACDEHVYVQRERRGGRDTEHTCTRTKRQIVLRQQSRSQPLALWRAPRPSLPIFVPQTAVQIATLWGEKPPPPDPARETARRDEELSGRGRRDGWEKSARKGTHKRKTAGESDNWIQVGAVARGRESERGREDDEEEQKSGEQEKGRNLGEQEKRGGSKGS